MQILTLLNHLAADDKMPPYQRLANGIVVQAARDYIISKQFILRYDEEADRAAWKNADRVSRTKHFYRVRRLMNTPGEVVRFLRSRWGQMVCATDTEKLIERLEKLDVANIALRTTSDEN